mgnify:CR=1 FL=1
MAGMNVFTGNAFSAISLTGAIEKRDYLPQLLGSLNLFEPEPVNTRNVMVDRSSTGLTLIPTSADGSPPAQLERSGRDIVNLRTTRLAKSFTMFAREIEAIRETGSETELMRVQTEYMKRMDRVNRDMELTHEYHRLGALQGLLLDADGTTVIYNYETEFAEVIPAPISFELDVTTTNIHKICKSITRDMARTSKGAMAAASVHSLCGDAFYDDLVSHPNVEKFYLNQAAARDAMANQGQVWESFTVGGITFHNYRGTDDNSTVAIPDAEARFFPVGAADTFKVAYAPHDSFDFVNTPGQRTYAQNVIDKDRNMWVMGELYSYPLYVNQRAGLVRKATRT